MGREEFGRTMEMAQGISGMRPEDMPDYATMQGQQDVQQNYELAQQKYGPQVAKLQARGVTSREGIAGSIAELDEMAWQERFERQMDFGVSSAMATKFGHNTS